jgi:hypothetical protein
VKLKPELLSSISAMPIISIVGGLSKEVSTSLSK